MKKYILSFLLIVCVMFCFAGCNNSMPEEYWQDTATKLTQFLDSEEFTATIDVTYSSNLQTIMASSYGKAYAELNTIYAPLYKQSIFCTQKYSNVFLQSKPISNSAKLYGEFKNIQKKLEDFKANVANFTTEKANYETNVDYTDQATATNEIEKARLKKFKLEYIKLIESAYGLSSEIFSAYTTGYFDFTNYDEIEDSDFTTGLIDINKKIALNASNLQLAHSSIKVVKLYINKEVDNDYDNYWQTSNNFFTQVESSFYDRTLSGNVLEKFKTWKNVYNAFLDDAKMFDEIVSGLKLNVLKKYNYDTKIYAEKTGDSLDQSRANFFLNYYKNVELLYNYTNNLVSGY